MPEITTVNVSDSPTPPPPPPPPPTQNRRPRTREVSSRFMTPSASTAQRRQQRDDSDDENSESSFPIGYSFQKKQQQQRVVKLFKESTNRVFENPPNPNPNPNSNPNSNSNYNSHHPPKSSSFSRSGINSTPCASRPDTPTPTISVSSRYRHTPQHRSINSRSSAATKSIQSRGNSISLHSHDDIGINCSTQSLPELCSENDKNVLMKESNVLTGSVAEKTGNTLSRSVSLSSSGIDHLRGSEKQHGSVIKQSGFGNQSLDRGKIGGLHLPPVVPQFAKPVVDTRKGKKGSSHQEDVHSLRLFYNRYLQWRFANARAACAMKAQQKECEKALFSRAMKISEMRNSVNRKRIELELLRRSKTLSIVLEAQIPYLDEWSAMEEDYSVSITEAIQALLNASMQLPTGGNVRVDVREVGESLNSALKVMETIVSNTQRLMPKAEETDTSISELARVVGGERALIEECGGLLSKTHKSQVEECSLRAQLIQLNSISHKNKE
ncbi:protein ENDOSPERM DEFECTIVE 1-like [Trifolium pratense]|uniref:Uncharacterized protein n=1 Tax=Trifolium pratense TaxID=57577 RepID=A0ACB0KLI4_TRIPR|nr:protein ENDOSPERM DEFECTIVE 1-like [Trifolium pratense]CAJ2658106.1 unnamed protein product [Trifolium pratense]